MLISSPIETTLSVYISKLGLYYSYFVICANIYSYKILNFVEEIDPENREVYLQKATIYSKNNLSEEAIEILKSALSFIDDKLEIWNMIAMEFLLLEDFESAIPFFKKCPFNEMSMIRICTFL